MARWAVLFKDRKINEAEMNVLLEEFSAVMKQLDLRTDEFPAVMARVTAAARFFPTPGDISVALKEERQQKTDSQKGYTYKELSGPEERATDEERAERIAILMMVMRKEIDQEEAVSRQKQIADRLRKDGRQGMCKGPDVHYALGAGDGGVYEEFKNIAKLADARRA